MKATSLAMSFMALLLCRGVKADDIVISWQGTAKPLTAGYLPKVATDGIQNAVIISETAIGFSALQSEIGTLLSASVAWAGGTTPIASPPSTSPQIVHAPSIALGYDSVTNYDNAVEVHQGGQDADGSLWFQLGTNAPPSFSGIGWSAATQYDIGYNPSVAADLNGKSGTTTTVVEVHQAGVDRSALWYHVGTLTLGSSPYLSWGPSMEMYDGQTEGYAPTVSVANNVAVLVAQGTAGTLWYAVGTVDPSTSTIAWTAPVFYSAGYNPTVSVYGDGKTDFIGSGRVVVEAHQVDSGTGPLAYSTGVLKGSAPTSITWSSQGTTYSSGCYPSVALSFAGSSPSDLSVTETHETACGSATTVDASFGFLMK